MSWGCPNSLVGLLGVGDVNGVFHCSWCFFMKGGCEVFCWELVPLICFHKCWWGEWNLGKWALKDLIHNLPSKFPLFLSSTLSPLFNPSIMPYSSGWQHKTKVRFVILFWFLCTRIIYTSESRHKRHISM
jgi:hypothetical protein